MEYEFFDSSIERENIILPNSDKISPFLLKNNHSEILKAVEFIATDDKSLHIHGFLGTGKRQFINYVCEFMNSDVIKLEYYCKESTVCDDILLFFNEYIEQNISSKTLSLNAKITTLGVKLKQKVNSIKKPILIVLHSFDSVLNENQNLITDWLCDISKESNIKIIVSTRAMQPGILGDFEPSKKVFLKALTKEVFREFIDSQQIKATQTTIEDFYKYTRGYYYYTALSIKIMQAMKIDLNEFLNKFNQSNSSFDSYLGITYINLLPTTIRNFFWFLRTIRHGLTINALAEFEIYDEFSISYLKTNLMAFQADETLYVQDYFLQKIDISIPNKTQIKLHKYIINIYENQLKAPLKGRAILISRQAMRAEIEYHSQCIIDIENGNSQSTPIAEAAKEAEKEKENNKDSSNTENKTNIITEKLNNAISLMSDKKYTDAIEKFKILSEDENIDLQTLVEVRIYLAKLYKQIGELSTSSHYYDLVEIYYKQHKEVINLNYLYYDMTDLYFKMYKNDRAIETIKKVIYSVDTPQSLMVSACTLLGNIYSEMNHANEAYTYYKKALESLDENVEEEVLADLYFKFALANDDKGETEQAYEYYNKCLLLNSNNPYKALAFSNLASCYLDNENYEDAIACFNKAYKIEKNNNNYDGIYYTASHLAKIYEKQNRSKALEFFLEAKKSAEFINEEFYILESTIALGDYYYNSPKTYDKALEEYFKAYNLVQTNIGEVDSLKIEQRIADMKVRMKTEDFEVIEKKYAK